MKVGDIVIHKLSRKLGRVITIDDKSCKVYLQSGDNGAFNLTAPVDEFEESESINLVVKEPQTTQNDGESKRYNAGKIQTREIDPNFILALGEVLTKSRVKYEHYNWQKPTKFSTPYESLMRHLLAFQSGEDIDKETGCSHLAHCATNIMFLMYHDRENKEYADDRGFKKKVDK